MEAEVVLVQAGVLKLNDSRYLLVIDWYHEKKRKRKLLLYNYLRSEASDWNILNILEDFLVKQKQKQMKAILH